MGSLLCSLSTLIVLSRTKIVKCGVFCLEKLVAALYSRFPPSRMRAYQNLPQYRVALLFWKRGFFTRRKIYSEAELVLIRSPLITSLRTLPISLMSFKMITSWSVWLPFWSLPRLYSRLARTKYTSALRCSARPNACSFATSMKSMP